MAFPLQTTYVKYQSKTVIQVLNNLYIMFNILQVWNMANYSYIHFFLYTSLTLLDVKKILFSKQVCIYTYLYKLISFTGWYNTKSTVQNIKYIRFFECTLSHFLHRRLVSSQWLKFSFQSVKIVVVFVIGFFL